jgi:hypothetical protein
MRYMTTTVTARRPSAHRTTPTRAAQLAATTPSGRDRYVDFLRVLSLAVVILGHWLMAVIVWGGGRLHVANVLESTPAARWLTWFFQIMPVFFVVGGFSNAASLAAARRDGKAYGDWLRGRLTRLVRPVLAFGLVWTAAVAVLRLVGIDPATVRAGSLAQPLWFLGVYIGVVALAPAMVQAHARWGLSVPITLGSAVAAVDVARWVFGVPLVGWLNFALVWLFAHQLGVLWREGPVATWSRRRFLVLAAGGLAGLVVLTQALGYPVSMVGGVGEARSNTFPPSFALVVVALWQFGAVLAARPAVDRLLARSRVWAAVVAANGLAMTLFLWHITAMALVAVAVLPTGLIPQPAAGTGAWWAMRPLWIALAAVALVPLVVAFARVEAARSRPAAVSAARAGAAAVVLMVGMALLARRGFASPGPLSVHVVAVALLVAGWWMLRGRTPAPADPQR